jgi:hypothetical protein
MLYEWISLAGRLTMDLRLAVHISIAATTLTFLTVSHARSDMVLGGASAEKYLVRHMAKSRNNFDCVTFFLQNRSLSRADVCGSSNKYVVSILERKGISRDNVGEIEELEKKILEFLFHSIGSKM